MGAAEKLCAPMRSGAMTRCVTALAVVSTMRGLSPPRVPTRRASVVMRRAMTGALGETRS